jgi:imidazolonepropionase-like amidohydrolase
MTSPLFAVGRVALATILPAALALLGARVAAQSSGGPARPPINGVTHVEPGWHAIVHAKVTAEPGTVIEDATIVVREGAIVSVTAKGEVPQGARVWDATGLEVYAGLVEPYLPVEARRSDKPDTAGAHWNPRVTPERTVLDGAGVPADVRKKLRSMGYGAALIAPSGPGILRGSCALSSLSEPGDAATPGVERVISRINAQTVAFDLTGVGDAEYPNSKMGVIAVIRQAFADAQWQQAAVMAFSRSPGRFERPVFSRALESLRQPVGWLFDAGDPLDIWRFTKIVREFRGEERVIAVGTGSEYQRLEAIKQSGAALIVPLAFPKRPRIATAADRDSVGLNELMAWEQAPTNPRRLDGAGIMTAITSSKLPKGGDFMENLRDAVTAGLSKDRALEMVTTRPAGLIGMSERLGKVAPGFIANFIVIKGEFFDPKREIRDVWIDGQRHEINAAPAPQAEALKGEWTLAAATAPAMTLTMKIGEKNEVSLERPGAEAPAAEAPAPAPGADAEKKPEAKKPAATKAKGVVQMENRLDFTLPGTALDPNFKPEPEAPAKPAEDKAAEKPADKASEKPDPGAALVSLIIEPAKDNAATLRGTATLPTGERVALTATRNPPKDGDKKKDEAKKDDDKPKPALVNIPETLTTPFGAYGLAAVPAQESVLITNATVWTNGNDGVLENASVHIAGGKIKAVGKSPLTIDPAFPVTREIDATGLHVTAGIIDCHSHTGISGGVNEGTQSCTSEVRIFDVINPDDIDWYRQLAGGVTGANQLHGSANSIGGQNSVVKHRWGVAVTPDDMRIEGAPPGIKFALGENVKQSNWGESNTTRYPQTRMGVETFIRDRFLAARAYKARWDAFIALTDNDKSLAEPPESDLELEALVEILDGKRLIHCHSYRQDEILMLCRVAKEFGFRIGTFQHVLEGYKVADAIKDAAIGASTFSDWWAYKWEVYDAVPSNGSIMHDVGVVVSFNSDSDELARRMNAEAGKAVKYGGVPPAEAMKFVTLNPAKQLRIDAMTGSIETGKDADLAVWSGDPLSPTSRCVRTFVDGRELFSLEQDKAHRERIASERARIMQKLLAEEPKKAKDDGKDKPDGASEGRSGGPGEGRRRRGGAQPPQDDLTSGGPSRSGLFTLVPVGGEDDETARAQAIYKARQVEARMEYLLRNGINPDFGRPGVCGCDL